MLAEQCDACAFMMSTKESDIPAFMIWNLHDVLNCYGFLN